MDITTFFIFLFILAIINTIISTLDIQKFLASNRSIKTPHNLENFKIVVRRQMYQALLQLLFLGGALLVGLYGIVTGKIGLLLVILLNMVIIGISQISKTFEKKARSLTVLDSNLSDEYRDICNTWVKNALPDF